MAYKFRALIGDELLGRTITSNIISCKPASDGTSVFRWEGANFDESGKKVDCENGIFVSIPKGFRKKEEVDGYRFEGKDAISVGDRPPIAAGRTHARNPWISDIRDYF